MDGEPRYTSGELARRTGLTVKAVRFYSDRGLVRPCARTAAGHRRYDVAALARLDLIRTLRELGLDLATVRKIVEREAALPDVAAAHADALAVQIRLLRLRRVVLTAVAKRGSTPEETTLMRELAQLSEEERRTLVAEFLDATFGGLDPAFAGVARSMTPELPDDADAEQVEAWIELAELTRDPEFRTLLRTLAEYQEPGLRRGLIAEAKEAAEAGVEPDSPEAAVLLGRVPGQAWLDALADPRRERYLELLAVVNGWAAPESHAPAVDWLVKARNSAP